MPEEYDEIEQCNLCTYYVQGRCTNLLMAVMCQNYHRYYDSAYAERGELGRKRVSKRRRDRIKKRRAWWSRDRDSEQNQDT